jgi:hypothetical protein
MNNKHYQSLVQAVKLADEWLGAYTGSDLEAPFRIKIEERKRALAEVRRLRGIESAVEDLLEGEMQGNVTGLREAYGRKSC